MHTLVPIGELSELRTSNRALMVARDTNNARIQFLRDALYLAEDTSAAFEARVLEQAAEIMALQADLSTARTEIATMRGNVEQLHRDSDGHNYCWRNLKRLFEQFGLEATQRSLPPLEEFKAGCEAFQRELFKGEGRWPDFIGNKRLADARDPYDEG
jgi:chromosome segregation ATPase